MFYITSIIILLVYSILDILKSNFTKKKICTNMYEQVWIYFVYDYICLYIFIHIHA